MNSTSGYQRTVLCAAAADRPPNGDDPGEEDGSSFGGAKISRLLVVEDEEAVASEIRRELYALGYVVVATARTADEAIDLATLHRPDLVLLDMSLPGERDGIAAAIEIQRRRVSRVIYLTAEADAAMLRRAAEAEPLGFIFKPFDRRVLSKALELAGSRLRGSA
jgi:DNA-binding NarL/FixJ family response regulator